MQDNRGHQAWGKSKYRLKVHKGFLHCIHATDRTEVSEANHRSVQISGGRDESFRIMGDEGCGQVSSKLCVYVVLEKKGNTLFGWVVKPGQTLTTLTPWFSAHLEHSSGELMGWRVVRQSGHPQTLAASSRKQHSQFQWKFTTTFITRDVAKFVHDIKKKSTWVFTFFSVMYFVGGGLVLA